MNNNKMILILLVVGILSFFLGAFADNRLCRYYKGKPITDEAARSYLFYMRTVKRFVENGEFDKLKTYVNEAYAIKENLFSGVSDSVAFDFFFRWEND